MDYSHAIQQANHFVRPIRFISRNFGTEEIIPGAGTMFFVNQQGVAVTCKHITELLKQAEPIQQRYVHYLNEKRKLHSPEQVQQLALSMGYQDITTAEILFTFVDSFDQIQGFQIIEHPLYDLAIIKFQGFQKIAYSGVAKFPKSNQSV